MTEKQKQLIESYIQKKIRKCLLESTLQIGDSGTIIDPKSLFKGKMGTIVGTVGREWLVSVLVNGNENRVLVSKTGIKKVVGQ